MFVVNYTDTSIRERRSPCSPRIRRHDRPSSGILQARQDLNLTFDTYQAASLFSSTFSFSFRSYSFENEQGGRRKKKNEEEWYIESRVSYIIHRYELPRCHCVCYANRVSEDAILVLTGLFRGCDNLTGYRNEYSHVCYMYKYIFSTEAFETKLNGK